MPVAFVLVKVLMNREAEVRMGLQAVDGVTEVHDIQGDHDLLCKVEAPDYDSMGDILTRGVRRVRGVESTATMAVRTLEFPFDPPSVGTGA